MGLFGWLKEEIDAVFQRDPAARNVLEVIFCYPGFHAIVGHRIHHFLYKHKVYFLARLLSQINRFFTGIEFIPELKSAAACSSITGWESSSERPQRSATTSPSIRE